MFTSFHSVGPSRSGTCMMQSAPGAIVNSGLNTWRSERQVDVMVQTSNVIVVEPDTMVQVDPAKSCRMQASVKTRRSSRISTKRLASTAK